MSNIICFKKLFYCLLVFVCAANHHVHGWYHYKMNPASVDKNLPKVENSSSSSLHLPEHFELSGPDAGKKFAVLVHNIENVSKGNFTVKYKVDVETSRVLEAKPKKKYRFNLRTKPKKYNTPLKKENMKLSNFEILMRKLAEEPQESNESHTMVNNIMLPRTTEFWLDAITTKAGTYGKYKPIINPVKTNFKSKVAPVRTNVMTLDH